MKTIYLHVGYHKTATTFFQHSVFPNLKNVRYIKKPKLRDDFRKVKLKKLSDAQIKEIRNRILHRRRGEKPLLISYEELSGNPFIRKKTKSQTDILKDLRRIFPASKFDVRIIVGLRDQVTLLTSLYVQYIQQGGVFTPHEFIEHFKEHDLIKNYNFNRYLRNIEDIFGDNYYVMVYETFKKNSEEEMLRLLNYMGEPEIPEYEVDDRWVNKSLGKLQVPIVRKLNRFFKSPKNPNGKFPIVKTKNFGKLTPTNFLQNKYSFAVHYKRFDLPEDIQTFIKSTYAGENKKLAERLDLDLPDRYF